MLNSIVYKTNKYNEIITLTIYSPKLENLSDIHRITLYFPASVTQLSLIYLSNPLPKSELT